ncbi:mycofactocin oligosaccharide methyltransferase MftM [Mycolicibacterium austroafricanum]|uniref:mycofactocin oligosaccharide methyltransferase MftM n=1 Tax=Mycolicibacterium austroafricanum TaxID=39687 RepID=UPI001401E9A7|nr:mycofactocin oligosaccharide methyltransferase MftM [Mycolicibacterium austroafricanum]
MDSAVLNPLAPSPHGVWSSHGVRVLRRRGPHRPHSAPGTVCTPRFCSARRGGLLTVEHDLTPDELCDELAVLLADQLVDSGALQGQSEFELVFTGVVRSTVDGGLPAWLRFYRNSLNKLENGSTAFAPIHSHAADLVRGGRLIDLGSCFGFFPLRLARYGIDVLATDLNDNAMRLLEQVSSRLCRPLTTMACDAADVPLPDGSADTVTALHLVEHLPDPLVDKIIDEAVRLARRRVIVAVPFEDQPRECYGHIQRFDVRRLQHMAGEVARRHPRLSAAVHEFHGGWLILDR